MMSNKTTYGCKKGTTKQSRINNIYVTGLHSLGLVSLKEQGLLSRCNQVPTYIRMINFKYN